MRILPCARTVVNELIYRTHVDPKVKIISNIALCALWGIGQTVRLVKLGFPLPFSCAVGFLESMCSSHGQIAPVNLDLLKLFIVRMASIDTINTVMFRRLPRETWYALKIVAPLAAAVWTLPVLWTFVPNRADPKVDLSRLQKFGITPELVRGYEEEVARDEMGGFVKFLQALSSRSIIEFHHAHLFPSLFPLILKVIEKGKLEAATMISLAKEFRKHGVFAQNKLDRDLTVTTSDNQVLLVHKVVLLMASDYFRKMLIGSYKEGQSKEVDLKVESRLLGEIIRYLYEGSIQCNNFSSELLIRLYNVSHCFLLEELSSLITEEMQKRAKDCTNEERLLQFIEGLAQAIALNEDEWRTSLIDEAMTAFFLQIDRDQEAHSSSFDRFILSEKHCTIPLGSFGYMQHSGPLGSTLREHVNCISLSQKLSVLQEAQLRMFETTIPLEIRNQITAIEIVAVRGSYEQHILRVKHVFPRLQTVCFRALLDPTTNRYVFENVVSYMDVLWKHHLDLVLVFENPPHPHYFMGSIEDVFAFFGHFKAFENFTDQTTINSTSVSQEKVGVLKTIFEEKIGRSIIRVKLKDSILSFDFAPEEAADPPPAGLPGA